MASKNISWGGVAMRFAVAVVLVFATYNPEGYSYYHWSIKSYYDWAFHGGAWPELSVLKLFVGVVLLIGWSMYLRATVRSLGAFGLVLAVAFFGTLLWLVVDMELVAADSTRAMSYLVLIGLCGVLTAGISWSHIRRRVSGQLDVDEVDGDL